MPSIVQGTLGFCVVPVDIYIVLLVHFETLQLALLQLFASIVDPIADIEGKAIQEFLEHL